MANPSGKQLDRHVEAVLAALDLLDCFLERPVLSIRELVRMTDMTRNRVTRLVGTLLHKGYLIEGKAGGTYTPGPKLLSLGRVFEANQNLVVLANPILQELASTTGESASFYIREGDERVVLARVEGTHAIRFTVTIGQRMALHAGAAGKVLLAFQPADRREQLLHRSLQNEHISPDNPPGQVSADALETIRTQGYAMSVGERNPDAFSLAAPVFQPGHAIIGALAIAGPISRNTPENRHAYLAYLLEAASTFSRKLNGNAHSEPTEP